MSNKIFKEGDEYIKIHSGLGFTNGLLFGESMTKGFLFDGVFLLYQFTQLGLNKRFFINNEGVKIEDGNSVNHTINKISNYFTGKAIGLVGYNMLLMN